MQTGTSRGTTRHGAAALLLSIDESARLLGISVRLTRKAIDDGALASVKIGRRRLIRRESLLRFAEQGYMGKGGGR